MKLLRVLHAALGGAHHPHVQQVRGGGCAPSAWPEGRSRRLLSRERSVFQTDH